MLFILICFCFVLFCLAITNVTVPTAAPTPDCDSVEHCWVSNDPHFLSWDGIWYDYHGVGYFDYVAPCNKDDYSLDTGIPFRVTVKQEQCSSWSATPTCVREVYITVVDGGTTTVVPFDNIAGTGMFFFLLYFLIISYIFFCFCFLFCFVFFFFFFLKKKQR